MEKLLPFQPNFVLIVVIIGTLISLVGDTFFGYSAKSGSGYNLPWFLVGWFIYGLSAIAWVISYKYEKFAIVATLYSVVLVLFSVLIGYLFFKEKLSPGQFLGVILGFISVFLLRM